jgi:two-component system response regulator HydG
MQRYPAAATSIERCATAALPLVVVGEAGTGKEVFAREVHARGPRRGGPFVVVDCARLGASIDDALYGGANGAPGLLEQASGGTIYLDEIGALPTRTQIGLRRVVDNGELPRLASTRVRWVDVRIVVATRERLVDLVAAGRLRADLFFRLHGITATLPPLRKCLADVLPIARAFAAVAAARTGRAPPSFTPDAEQLLLCQEWPANLRELRSTIERAAAAATAGVIDVGHLDGLAGTRRITCPCTRRSRRRIGRRR